MNDKNRCPYCDAQTYNLADGRVLCRQCKKKSSPKQTKRAARIIKMFCEQESALTCSQMLNISYATAATMYKKLRHIILLHSQNSSIDLENCEYDEYLFLYKNKKSLNTALFDAHNFLTFACNRQIYTKLLPSLRRFHTNNETQETSDTFNEFARFLNRNRISKMKKQNSTILLFWDFLQHYIDCFRGIESQNFIYYLKSAEFLFNHPKEESCQLLQMLWFQSKVAN
jgi:transposase